MNEKEDILKDILSIINNWWDSLDGKLKDIILIEIDKNKKEYE